MALGFWVRKGSWAQRPLRVVGVTRRLSPLTGSLEVGKGCARTVARTPALVFALPYCARGVRVFVGGRHGIASVAGSVVVAPGVQGACPRRGFGGGAPITMPAKPSLIATLPSQQQWGGMLQAAAERSEAGAHSRGYRHRSAMAAG